MKKLYPIAVLLIAALILAASGCGSNPKKTYFDWLAEGDTNMKARKFDEAVKDYDEALKVRQDDPLVWFYRGNALFRLGKQQDALRFFMAFHSSLTIKTT